MQLTNATVVEVKAGLGGGGGEGVDKRDRQLVVTGLLFPGVQGATGPQPVGRLLPCAHPGAPWARTRQSECLGPVQPAAHCSWQQSVGFGPLQRAQPPAQTVRVTVRQGAG